jgi:hypothetical protein
MAAPKTVTFGVLTVRKAIHSAVAVSDRTLVFESVVGPAFASNRERPGSPRTRSADFDDTGAVAVDPKLGSWRELDRFDRDEREQTTVIDLNQATIGIELAETAPPGPRTESALDLPVGVVVAVRGREDGNGRLTCGHATTTLNGVGDVGLDMLVRSESSVPYRRSGVQL